MSQTYEIFNEEDFLNFVAKIGNFFTTQKEQNLPFIKLNITCKQWRKPKTSLQHRKYFALIGKLKPLFRDAGYQVNENDINGLFKASMGFTKCIDGVIFTKSISDLSLDASSKVLNDLIEFALQYGAENFGVDLEAGNVVS